MVACIYIADLSDDARSRLRECAESFSPQIEEPEPGLVLLDVRGLGLLHGSPERIAGAIAACASKLGDDVRVAVAGNRFAARVAALGFAGTTIIRPGTEAERLGGLPVTLLDPSQPIADTLAAWGIRTFAQLARLPETGLAERLGAEGVEMYRRARGLCDRPLAPDVAPAVFEASFELEHPLELLEPLSFLLSRLLNEICTKLGAHGFAANEIGVRLTLDPGAGSTDGYVPTDAPSGSVKSAPVCVANEHNVTLRLPYAGRDATAFLKLLQLELAAHPPHAPVLAIAVRAQPVEPRRVQTGLFTPQAPESEKLELTLARLRSVVGGENVGSPELPDTHRPGAFRMRRFVTDAAAAPAGNAAQPRLALRLFRPPLPVRVIEENGRPRRIEARGIRGDVAAWAGPWRSSGDWWRPDFWARDEWDIALAGGGVYRLYRTNTRVPEWFLEGNYD